MLSRPYSIGDRFGKEHVSLTVCAGLEMEQPASTFESLFMNAEAALSAAKQIGPGSTALFTEAMESSHAQRERVRLELPKAIAYDQLDVVYQPIVTLSTLRANGADALVRWIHPDLGPIAAADFLPFAWENGMRADIGRLVMRAVVSALPVLSGDADFRVYVNISAQELSDPALLSDLRSLFMRSAGRLALEIAESVMMRDTQWAISLLDELKERGLAIVMDDFGSGHSSITDLKRLPLDAIKIDGNLVRGLPDDPESCAVVEALLSVAQRFGHATIAKNVENARQLEWLQAHNCTMGQGFYFAQPMSAPEFRAWAASVHNHPAVA